jgi:hypothetical protein
MLAMRRIIQKFPLEQMCWSIGLLSLAVIPLSADEHLTICPLALLGFDWCPGCGLGRAISLAFHGQFQQSFQTHPLGLFAIGILTFRIISLSLKNQINYGKDHRRSS